MGFVFKARQPKLNRLVALKILPHSLAADPAFAERFTREGRVLAQLNHPNIVTIHDFGQANGLFYLLMEFVDGVNLRQAMQAGRFTPAQALAVVPKICEALQYAHNEGILHRDIKPENVLIDGKGRVKIADFGIAKLVGDAETGVRLTASGAAFGTPHYMAPEQIEKPSEVDHRADIYSLGVVFYEMLTGELPLGRFAPPSQKSDADPRLDEVVFRTLEKEPARRFQTADEVRTQVQTIVDTAPASALPPSPATIGPDKPPLRASASYVSSPEHLRTFLGHLFPYTGKGGLRLDAESLSFTHPWYTVVIPLSGIWDLSIGHYPWSARPVRVDFISVTFDENSGIRRTLFTPYEDGLKTTWHTNRVTEWFSALREAITTATGRAPGFTPHEEMSDFRATPWTEILALAVIPGTIALVSSLCSSFIRSVRDDQNRLFGPGPILLHLGVVSVAIIISAGLWWFDRRRGEKICRLNGGSGRFERPRWATSTILVIGSVFALMLLPFPKRRSEAARLADLTVAQAEPFPAAPPTNDVVTATTQPLTMPIQNDVEFRNWVFGNFRHILASEGANAIAPILQRPGRSASPSPENRSLTVTGTAEEVRRAAMMLFVTDWPTPIRTQASGEYVRDDRMETARAFFHACALFDPNDPSTAKALEGLLSKGVKKRVRENNPGLADLATAWLLHPPVQLRPRPGYNPVPVLCAFEDHPGFHELNFVQESDGYKYLEGTNDPVARKSPLLLDSFPPWFDKAIN